MADFAAAWSAHWAGFADAVWWEVVVVQIAAGVDVFDAIEELVITQGTEGGDAHDLRLTTGEDGAAVGAWQKIDFAGERAHFGDGAAVWALVLEGDELAHDLLHHGFQGGAEVFLLFWIFFDEGFDGFVLDSADGFVAGLLVDDLQRFLELVVGSGFDIGDDVFRQFDRFDVDLVLGDACCQGVGAEFFDHGDDALDLFVAEHNGVEHLFFRHFLGAGFDHHDGVEGAGDGQMHAAFGALGFCWVDDEFIADETNADASDRTHEWGAGQMQRCGGADHGAHVWFVVCFHREHGGDDLNVTTIALWEERTDRTVDETGRQCGCFRRTAFAAQESARDFPDGVHFFFVVYSEREEIHAFAWFFARGGGDEHDCVAVANENGATRLFGQMASFNA